jgi:predicted enzyme related to lactoylglutathione lyase
MDEDPIDSGFIATFADTDDNYFQLMSPMPEPDA